MVSFRGISKVERGISCPLESWTAVITRSPSYLYTGVVGGEAGANDEFFSLEERKTRIGLTCSKETNMARVPCLHEQLYLINNRSEINNKCWKGKINYKITT